MTPLTEARLAEIRERHDVDARDPYLDECDNMTREAHADRAALLAHVESLQAALRQAEGERLLLALGWAEDFDIHAPRMPLNKFLKARDTARRIVAAANGGRDGD